MGVLFENWTVDASILLCLISRSLLSCVCRCVLVVGLRWGWVCVEFATSSSKQRGCARRCRAWFVLGVVLVGVVVLCCGLFGKLLRAHGGCLGTESR